jgi:hypothetical protein
MSFTEGHALCCDCDECLNRGGGQKLESPVVVHPTPALMPRRRSQREAWREVLAERQWTGW